MVLKGNSTPRSAQRIATVGICLVGAILLVLALGSPVHAATKRACKMYGANYYKYSDWDPKHTFEIDASLKIEAFPNNCGSTTQTWGFGTLHLRHAEGGAHIGFPGDHGNRVTYTETWDCASSSISKIASTVTDWGLFKERDTTFQCPIKWTRLVVDNKNVTIDNTTANFTGKITVGTTENGTRVQKDGTLMFATADGYVPPKYPYFRAYNVPSSTYNPFTTELTY